MSVVASVDDSSSAGPGAFSELNKIPQFVVTFVDVDVYVVVFMLMLSFVDVVTVTVTVFVTVVVVARGFCHSV